MCDIHDMLEAVDDNNLNKIKFLIQMGNNSPNKCDGWGQTVLHKAVVQERTDIVEYLLSLPDIDLEQREASSNCTPLLLSVKLQNPEIFKMLNKKGANLNVTYMDGDTILHKAILTGPETVRLILTTGFDVNVTNNDGVTPLHGAVLKNDFELVSMLLYYNAENDVMDVDGYTPFIRALCNRCDENIQRELFKYECDYNRETDNGSTLFLAVANHSPLITDLIENGADVNYYCDDIDKSILGLILENYDPEIFYFVFPLTNLSILTKCKMSILNSFLNSDYNKEDWLKALFLILESNILTEFIDHFYMDVYLLMYHYISDDIPCLFKSFVEVFRKKNISEDEFVKFVDICLCSGADVMLDDIKIVYEVYSNNKALPHLLYMKIAFLPEFNFSLPLLFCSFNKNFICVLNEYYEYDNNLDNTRASSVPSLLELSRNETIIAICTKYDINRSHWYYYILRRLNLPKVIYDYLTFRCLIK